MAENPLNRFRNAWNAFLGRDPTDKYLEYGLYGGSYQRPDRTQLSYGNDKSIVTAIYNRIALDVSQISVRHVNVDENNQYLETRKSTLNDCLTLSANLDQTGKAFMQDIVMSMFDEGCVAVIPTDTDTSPKNTDGFDIYSMRTGKVVEWFPHHVKVEVYNENTGKKEKILVEKRTTAIIENPFYAIMNEPNSVLRRLIRKLVLLDAVDEQSSAGKLDLIIQLPYTIKGETRRKQAEERRDNIEKQLAGSKYGIAYADATERITQLNRPIENNLMKQIEYLTNLLYGQLGISETILNGTADEQTMLNYFSSTIEPILSAIVDEFKRKFLSKTARTQGQSIMYFREPFKLAPVKNIAEVAEKLITNRVLTSNEVRGVLGYKPAEDAEADKLLNPNIDTMQDAASAEPEPDLTEEQLE
ncbi:MAG: phage portal protein [Pseudobutyrivibrio sp.]|nr:phage portal protein [Pseudobutyrivibrio sp.]